jgi:hypothetical protein
MPRPKTSITGAYRTNVAQTLSGIAANSTADFVLSCKGAQPEWFYTVTNRALPAGFVISNAWCSSINGIAVRLSNVTGASAALGSCSFDVIGL